MEYVSVSSYAYSYFKNYTHIVTGKREFQGFFEGVKMAQVGYNWKGTVAPMLIE